MLIDRMLQVQAFEFVMNLWMIVMLDDDERWYDARYYHDWVWNCDMMDNRMDDMQVIQSHAYLQQVQQLQQYDYQLH